MGRPRMPAAVKMERGTFRPDRDGDPDLIPMPGKVSDLTAPETLGEVGLNHWNLWFSELVRLNVLTMVDVPAFVELCTLFDKIARLEDLLDKDGEWYQNDKGNYSRHPAALQRTQYVAERATLMDRFGLNPSSRGKLQVKPPEKKKTVTFQPLGGRG